MHHTDTVHPDTTLDKDDAQANVSDCSDPSAHSRLRSVSVSLAERASLTGYEPSEQFDDLDFAQYCVDTE